MLILLLIFFSIFNHPIFAIPSVVISSVPDVVTAGTTFPVSFSIIEASSSASYYYKFFGGVDNDVYKISNSPDLSYSSSWVNFPQITLDPGSSNIFNSFAYIKSDVNTNILNLKIRIALTTDTNTKFGATSPAFSVEVVSAPPPTSTPTPTPAPTETPVPTKTPNPTKIPTLTPTLTPNPTIIPTENITPIPTEFIDETLTNYSVLPSSTPIPKNSVLGVTNTVDKKNFLPLFFICLGGLLLLTPLIIAKIKHES